MMKTVFMVTSGRYSDYGVLGIFSTKANAEEFMRSVPDDYYNDIEEMALDPAIKEIRAGQSCWYVLMLRDGTTECIERRDVSRFDLGSVGSGYIWRRTEAPAYRGKGVPDVLVCTVWAKDEMHAIKVTNEIRTRRIAEGSWN